MLRPVWKTLLEQVRLKLLPIDLQVSGDVGQDAAQRADPQRVVKRNCHMVLVALDCRTEAEWLPVCRVIS